MLRDKPTTDERGQTYSLEGIVAALLIILSVSFAINATAITPLTVSTSNKQIEGQNRLLAEDVLSVSADNGNLQEQILQWEGETKSNVRGDMPMGEILTKTFANDQIAVNMYVTYTDGNGQQQTDPLVRQGEPSDHAAVATHTVVLYDYMEGPNGQPIGEDSTYAIPDADSDSNVYNVVEVKLEVWRM